MQAVGVGVVGAGHTQGLGLPVHKVDKGFYTSGYVFSDHIAALVGGGNHDAVQKLPQTDLLALHQPVASDLRRVITVLKVNGEIERVGDLAVNIAERVEDIAAHQAQAARPLDFAVMVDKACLMLRHALDALAYGDANLAESVIDSDEEVDQLHRDMYSQVRQAMLDCPELASYYLNGLTISRCLERIADIATNIAEDVVYMESGRIVRHLHEGEKHVH